MDKQVLFTMFDVRGTFTMPRSEFQPKMLSLAVYGKNNCTPLIKIADRVEVTVLPPGSESTGLR